MDDSWLRGVPVGLVLFVGTALGFARRAWSKRAARASFPALGTRLGLQYSPPETPGAAGVLKGEVQGFSVRVESDSRARLVLRLPETPAFDLRSYDRWVRLPPGLQPFALGDRGLNAWLRTRLASVEVAGRLSDDHVLRRSLQELRQHPNLREFTAAEGRIELVFDFGARGLFPVDAAEKLLSATAALAERLVALAVAPGVHAGR